MENENPIEEAKLMQSIETNDKLETIGKNTEASILAQDETKEAIKDLQPSLDAIMLNTEPKEIQKVQLVTESEEDDDSLAVNFYKMLRGKKGERGDKGEDGYTPKKGEDYFTEEEIKDFKTEITPKKGKDYFDGKDYILTVQDKKEIAKNIKVPIVEKIVEKVEVIRETPIIIDKTKNVVKEVSKYEPAKDIAKKLNTLVKEIDFKVIKNFPDFGKGGSGLNTVFTDGTTISGNGLADNPLRAVNTVTNKRTPPTVVQITQSATPTINTDNGDVFEIVGLAQAITSMTTNLSGNPVEGEMIEIIFKDNGTARAITWGASFVSSGNVTLPTTTVISTELRVLFQRRTSAVWTSTSAWVCIDIA